MKFFCIVLLLLCGAAIAQADETIYVQSLKAKILQEPNFNAQVIGLAGRGDTLVATARRGTWYQISYKNEIGFIAALLVADRPPAERKQAVTADADIGKRARRRASAVATAGATRGLTADDRRRASQSNMADYDGLSFMEEEGVSEAAAADFLSKGLGE